MHRIPSAGSETNVRFKTLFGVLLGRPASTSWQRCLEISCNAPHDGINPEPSATNSCDDSPAQEQPASAGKELTSCLLSNNSKYHLIVCDDSSHLLSIRVGYPSINIGCEHQVQSSLHLYILTSRQLPSSPFVQNRDEYLDSLEFLQIPGLSQKLAVAKILAAR